MNLKGLQFASNLYRYTHSYWPSSYDHFVDNKECMFYIPENHKIRIAKANGYSVNKITKHKITKHKMANEIKQIYPTARLLTDSEMEQIKKRYTRAENAAASAKKRNKFITELTGGAKLENDRKVHLYLRNDPSTPDGSGSGVHINGQSLCYYGGLLLHRIGENEYLLGRELTPLARNSPSCSSRILATLQSQKGIITWPSLIGGWGAGNSSSADDPFRCVAEYLQKVFTICQLKMPTARDKQSYNDIFNIAESTYAAACKRWHKQDDKVEELLTMYGDIPKMKEFNAALRMQFELMGEVTI